MQARISRYPGSEIAGVPASLISTTLAPRSICWASWHGPLGLVSLVVGDEPRSGDLQPLVQAAGATGVLAGDQVGLGKRPLGAGAEVLEVSDRRRADGQPARH